MRVFSHRHVLASNQVPWHVKVDLFVYLNISLGSKTAIDTI